MQGDGSRRGAGGGELYARGCRLAAAGKPLICLAACLMAAGCASIGQALGPSAPASGASIAFESIDGLPREVSPKLAHDLDEEAAALRIAVIPAGGAGQLPHPRLSGGPCGGFRHGGRLGLGRL